MDSRNFAGSTTASLRLINARRILEELRATNTAHSISMLASRTGLTPPTISGAIELLIDRGWVVERVPPSAAKQGRPGRFFGFNTEGGFVVGLDLRPNSIHLEVANLGGAIVTSKLYETVSLDDLAAVCRAIESASATAVSEAGINRDQILAVTAAVPGVVDNEGRLWKSVVVPHWVGDNLGKGLREIYPRASCVMIENASNLAAIAEDAVGVGRTASSMIHLLVDEKIGVGIIVGGQLLRGFRGASGEIGALEQFGWNQAADKLSRRMKSAMLNGKPNLTDPNLVSAVQDFASEIAGGVAALVLTCDPELVVLGGTIAGTAEVSTSALSTVLAQLCLYTPRIEHSSLGDQAVVRGATISGLRNVDIFVLPESLNTSTVSR